jgi:hypothetical protein
MRVTEDNSKIISEILVEINGSTGVHVHCVETDPGEYYKFFLKNEEKILLFRYRIYYVRLISVIREDSRVL